MSIFIPIGGDSSSEESKFRDFIAKEEAGLKKSEEKKFTFEIQNAGIFKVQVENIVRVALVPKMFFSVDIKCAGFSDGADEVQPKNSFESTFSVKQTQIPAVLEVVLKAQNNNNCNFKLSISQEYDTLKIEEGTLKASEEKDVVFKVGPGKYLVAISNNTKMKNKPVSLSIGCNYFNDEQELNSCYQYRSKPFTVRLDQNNSEVLVKLSSKNHPKSTSTPFKVYLIEQYSGKDIAKDELKEKKELNTELTAVLHNAVRDRNITQVSLFSSIADSKGLPQLKIEAERLVIALQEEEEIKKLLLESSDEKQVSKDVIMSAISKSDEFQRKWVNDPIFKAKITLERESALKNLKRIAKCDSLQKALKTAIDEKNAEALATAISQTSEFLASNSDSFAELQADLEGAMEVQTSLEAESLQIDELHILIDEAKKGEDVRLLASVMESAEKIGLHRPKAEQVYQKARIALKALEKKLEEANASSSTDFSNSFENGNNTVNSSSYSSTSSSSSSSQLIGNSSNNNNNNNNNSLSSESKTNENEKIEKNSTTQQKNQAIVPPQPQSPQSQPQTQQSQPPQTQQHQQKKNLEVSISNSKEKNSVSRLASENGIKKTSSPISTTTSSKATTTATTTTASSSPAKSPSTPSPTISIHTQRKFKHSQPLIDKLHTAISQLMQTSQAIPGEKLLVDRNNPLSLVIVRLLHTILSDRPKKKLFSKEKMAFEIFKGISFAKFFVDEFQTLEALRMISDVNRELATSMLFVSYLLEKGCLVGLVQELFNNPSMIRDRYEPDSVMFCDDLIGVLMLLLQIQFKLGLDVEPVGVRPATPNARSQLQMQDEQYISQIKSSIRSIATKMAQFTEDEANANDLEGAGDELKHPAIGNLVRGELCKSLFLVFSKGLKSAKKQPWNVLEAVAASIGKQNENSIRIFESISPSELFATGITTINESINMMISRPGVLDMKQKAEDRLFCVNNAKFRAFVCYCLNYKILGSAIRTAIEHQKALAPFYSEANSFVCHISNPKSPADVQFNKMKVELHFRFFDLLGKLSQLPFHLSISFDENRHASATYIDSGDSAPKSPMISNNSNNNSPISAKSPLSPQQQQAKTTNNDFILFSKDDDESLAKGGDDSMMSFGESTERSNNNNSYNSDDDEEGYHSD